MSIDGRELDPLSRSPEALRRRKLEIESSLPDLARAWYHTHNEAALAGAVQEYERILESLDSPAVCEDP